MAKKQPDPTPSTPPAAEPKPDMTPVPLEVLKAAAMSRPQATPPPAAKPAPSMEIRRLDK